DQTVGVDDIGTLTNVAEATGTGGGDTATATDDATVEIVQVAGEVLEPGIEVVKEALVPVDDDSLQTVTVEEDGTAEVRYRYTITNTGNTTLEDLTLVDDVIGDLSGELEGVSLEPDGSTEVEVDYTTTRAQLDEGSVTNIATVTGTSPEGATVDDDDEVTVDLVEVLDTSITSPQEDDDATMPDTGAATTLLAVLALAMAALGSLLLMAGRRRRTSME
ncbi:MAG: LPXTG cell wall anchor domain-containing protein, partial [Nitriliruptoraceae bacterium]